MEKEIYLTLLQGFLTGAGLIIAIGAQNAFVLRQGLMKNQVFVTALFCTLADAALLAMRVVRTPFPYSFLATACYIQAAVWAAFLADWKSKDDYLPSSLTCVNNQPNSTTTETRRAQSLDFIFFGGEPKKIEVHFFASLAKK